MGEIAENKEPVQDQGKPGGEQDLAKESHDRLLDSSAQALPERGACLAGVVEHSGDALKNPDASELYRPASDKSENRAKIETSDKQVGLIDDPKIKEQRDFVLKEARAQWLGPIRERIEKQIESEGFSRHEAEKQARICVEFELEQMQKNMVKFEERSSELVQMYEKMGLTQTDAQKQAHEQIAQTYYQIGRLYHEQSAVPGIGMVEKAIIGKQILLQASDPRMVFQDRQSKTCGPAAVSEVRGYHRQPGTIAEVVADIALSGHHLTRGGTNIVVDPESIIPHGNARKIDPGAGERSLASQIFQVAAVNDFYKLSGRNIIYKQQEPRDGMNGEELWDMSSHPPKLLSDGPEMTPFEIIRAANDITNRDDYIMIDQDRFMIRIRNDKTHTLEDTTLPVSSAVDVDNYLKILSDGGGMPVPVVITDGKVAHVINVIEYHPGNPSMVKIDDTGGATADMPVSYLYSILVPGSGPPQAETK